ncbi:Ankyrin repeat-containing protein [Musa troglodytarum]|uniref:Ankyrin repeat-containing protein n=1 Tax=Musa troglodytarum TaxID=320322 RepID=A0A9E7JQI1_9LILI|nr:Ankyrin repeat-containing protein [Musa troglodytarum]URD89104.1 Ankyrin repeat-containing protein [Musa troglodytarum]
MGDPALANTDSIHDGTEDADPLHVLNRRHFLTVKSHIRQKKHEELLALAGEDPDRPVNLMNDTLLHVVIACNETDLAKRIIQQMPVETLAAKNLYGDTALHVAAAVGNSEVARELFRRSEDLIGEHNLKQETPLHKAAFYGHHDMFWCLVNEGQGSPYERREDGATMLHCAIMGNAPGLALEIAEHFPLLITSRNTMAVTPLQLMVTIPGLFRSQMVLGSSESILYNLIPFEKDSRRTRQRDEEEAPGSPNDAPQAEAAEQDDHEYFGRQRTIRSRCLSCCCTLVDILLVPVKWALLFPFIILRAFYPRTRQLEEIKITHRKALELIEYLVRDPTYMEFYVLGRKQSDGGASAASFRERGERQDQLNAPAASTRRWNEPPLILGAQMGIPEYVSTILQVCPEAATYLDTRGRSVLQVAIEHGNREIVRTIREMSRGKNPVLPSWLLSRVDKGTGRTILHLASANAPEHNQDALQMQDQLRWFETVRDMVPKKLVYSRNAQEMTAEEIFTESHQALLKSCKVQLMETGRMCSGLVAAVVFASSFSIPGDKDPATGNPIYFGRAAFKVFSHAYVFGLSCAATSLVLFLSLAMSPYKEQQFRRIIPTKYFFASSSFGLAMLSFLVAFTCNIYLQLYGWQKTKSKDLIPFVLELTLFPLICFLVLFYRGSEFGLSFLYRSWR